jgi:hypothetical protein
MSCLNHPSFRQLHELIDFFKKKCSGFPLYWLVLALWFVLGVQFASRLDALVIIFGLHGFLSPMYSSVLATGWWFIGVILVLYHDPSAGHCTCVGRVTATCSDESDKVHFDARCSAADPRYSTHYAFYYR